MEYTYNITFVTAPETEDELLVYLRMHLLPDVIGKTRGEGCPDLKKVKEAGDEKPGPDEGASIAFSLGFDKEEQALFWRHSILSPALDSFHKRFGEKALYFITLLENIRL